MTTNHRLQEIRRFALVLAAGLVPGLLLGHAGWFVAAALAAYAAWLVSELMRLRRWLNEDGTPAESATPEGTGLPGEIFDGIYRLRKRERAAQAELQSLIDRARDSVVALRDAVVIVTREEQLEWWNPAAEHLLGFSWPKDRGQLVTNLVREPAFRRYIESGDYSQPLECHSPRSDGIHLQVQLTVFGNGDRLMIARDVTRIHQLEQTRRDFVANVSHELRTPLTVIRGYLDALRDGELPPRLVRAVGQMHQQAERMNRLVDDLLLLSRLESTAPEARPDAIPVRTLLERIREDIETVAQEKGHAVSLRIDSESRLLGSDSELQSAFSNILVNAAKYTPPNGDIAIHWWVDAKGAHLAIRDSGVGIESQHLPRLTERFYRTDRGRSIAEGGTGLGLAIVKHVLKRHDASLEIHSEPGKGSTFTCHFPRERVMHHPGTAG